MFETFGQMILESMDRGRLRPFTRSQAQNGAPPRPGGRPVHADEGGGGGEGVIGVPVSLFTLYVAIARAIRFGLGTLLVRLLAGLSDDPPDVGVMPKRLYYWTLSLAAGPNAGYGSPIAFVESSVFLVPADALFVPWRWHARREPRATPPLPPSPRPLAALPAISSASMAMRRWPGRSSNSTASSRPSSPQDLCRPRHHHVHAGDLGLTDLPPIKVVTILAGVINVGLIFFIVSCLLFRGARFLALAILIRRYGDPIREWIAQRLGLIAALAACSVVLYLALRFGLGGGGFPCFPGRPGRLFSMGILHRRDRSAKPDRERREHPPPMRRSVPAAARSTPGWDCHSGG